MWLAAELLVTLWVVFGGWWLWRRGPAACLSTGTGLVFIYGSAVLASWGCALVLGRLDINRWLLLSVVCLAGTVSLVAAARWWRARGERQRACLARALAGWRSHVVQAVILAGWTAVHFVAWVLLTNLLVAAHPEAAASARDHSLFTGRLLGTPAGRSWEGGLSEQQGQMQAIGRGVDSFLDATGTRQVMELMDAIGWISRLDGDERARLVAASPELVRLTRDPALLAVIDDARLMGLVDEAMHGSLPATYALGSEPAVIALIESPAMRAAVLAIDPVALRRQAAPAGDGLAVAWQQAAITTSLGLDAQLVSTTGWTRIDGDHLRWETHLRFGVARAALPADRPRNLSITTTADCSCWFAGRLLRPSRHGIRLEAGLPADAGELILLIDFSGIPQPHLVTLTVRPTP